jgi:hypothetical protein
MLQFHLLLTGYAQLAHGQRPESFRCDPLSAMIADSEKAMVDAEDRFLDIQKQMPVFMPAIELDVFAGFDCGVIEWIR